MSNTSASGGYLLPAEQPPLPGNLTFTQFTQQVFVGISGLPGQLVRPRWELNPPKEPDLDINWLAFEIQRAKPDANPYNGVNSPQFATGTIELFCNPKIGSTVVINGLTITFVSSSPTGNQVQVGSLPKYTALNLQTFLQGSVAPEIEAATYSVYLNVITATASLTGSDGNAFTLVSLSQGIEMSGPTLTGGSVNANITQRHEELDIQCAIYGPDALANTSLVRDGFYIPQNLEALRSVNMGLREVTEAMRVPDLVNERWRDRWEMTVSLRREILRSYPILNILSVAGTITAGFANSSKTVSWSAT